MKYTQEQLEGMSDFDLNCLVAEYDKDEKLPKDWRESHFFSRSGDCLLSISLKTLVKNYCNYCNNWADMGPLILCNNIVLTPCMGENSGDVTAFFIDKNPITLEFDDNSKALRAAAIVYILAKQEGLA